LQQQFLRYYRDNIHGTQDVIAITDPTTTLDRYEEDVLFRFLQWRDQEGTVMRLTGNDASLNRANTVADNELMMKQMTVGLHEQNKRAQLLDGLGIEFDMEQKG
jgi:hypothetical protein